jgi:hypothetical protein
VPAGKALAIVSPDRFLLHWRIGDQPWHDDTAASTPGNVYAAVLGAGQLTGGDLTFTRRYLDRVTATDPASGWEGQDHVVQVSPPQAQN